MAYIRGEAAGQSSLFPVSLDELIPTDPIVRVMDAHVAQLDLVALEPVQYLFLNSLEINFS